MAKNNNNNNRSNAADRIKARFGGSSAVLAPTTTTTNQMTATPHIVNPEEIEIQSRKEVEQAIQISGKPDQLPVRETRSVYDLEPGRYQGMLRDMQRVIDPSDEEFQTLLESIRAYGFRGELLISKNDKIYSGHRRWAVLKWLHENEGWPEHVSVLVVNVPDADELSFMTRFNSTSQQLTKEAVARIVDEYYNRQGFSIRDIVSKTGFKKHDVEQAIKIAQLPTDVQQAIDNKRVTIRDAVATLKPSPVAEKPTTANTVSDQKLSIPQIKVSEAAAKNSEVQNQLSPSSSTSVTEAKTPLSVATEPIASSVSAQPVRPQVADVQLKKLIRQLAKIEAELNQVEKPVDVELVKQLQELLNSIQSTANALSLMS